MLGIVSYGFYVPKYRITTDEIARNWGKKSDDVTSALNIDEKTVSGMDEDALTMAYQACTMAITQGSIDLSQIKAVFVGSESHPYVVNPTSTILAEFLGIEANYFASDMQFACKAGIGSIIPSLAMVSTADTKYSLAVGSDKASARPHDPLEYSASSGAAAFIIGKNNVLVEIVDWYSFSSDTPDFWRREGSRYPSHGGRFTGKPSYFRHISSASRALMKKVKKEPSDFAHAVFHMPNGKFPERAAHMLGFNSRQLQLGLTVKKLGNSYTASVFLGLCSVLERAVEDDLIFVCSFGSGAGSDAFVLRVTENLKKFRQESFNKHIMRKQYIDYATYLKYTRVI